MSNHNSNGRKAGSKHAGSDSESNSVYSGVSVTSSYRHSNAGPFTQLGSDAQPKPVLSKDVNHKPKTTGSLGILVVGLGGANGCTLAAGILANRTKLEWHGPRGEHMQANWYGCITQLNQKGGGVGYKDKVRGLADATLAAVGGWVSTSSGDCSLCHVFLPVRYRVFIGH
jgi:Myo-inositol-1-phosphate synthase